MALLLAMLVTDDDDKDEDQHGVSLSAIKSTLTLDV